MMLMMLTPRILAQRFVRICCFACLLTFLPSVWLAANPQDEDQVHKYNVVLADGHTVPNHCSPAGEALRVIPCAVKPEIIPGNSENESRYLVIALIDCDDPEKAKYRIPVSRVKRIETLADPIHSPYEVEADTIEIDKCCRLRDFGFLGMHKLEVRGLIGYRAVDDETYQHKTANGFEPYPSSFINFDRGGSNLVLGVEAAGLWSLDEEHHFLLGPLLGIWPVDGAIFLPLAIHGRYSFQPNPDNTLLQPCCNTFYLYADLGLPFDTQTEAPVFGPDFDRQRYFYTLGVGHDWAWGCDMDFSLDLGIRTMNMPLPQIECCPDVQDDARHPYRKSTSVILRFGLSW